MGHAGDIQKGHIHCDATEDRAEATLNESVVWIGRSGSLTRTAADLAREAGTIPWEILTRIHPSLPRLLP